MLFTGLGALLGALFGGVSGFFIGGVLGYVISFAVRHMLIGGLQVAQSQLLDSTFAIMGAVCKADSVVTRDEIDMVEQTFNMLKMNKEQRRSARDAFNRGKHVDFDLDAAVDQFAQISRGRGPLVQLFLQLQVMAVAADGVVHPAEHEMLVRIATRLGLSESDISQLEALLRASTGRGSKTGGVPTQNRLADAYAALGVSPDSSASEIKRAYRKLMSENHPDKLAARGLPESMRPVAEERSREINSAYDLIKEARNDVR